VAWHGYIGIENLDLNNAQRDTLRAELQALGPASDRQPARLNHWRLRLDIQAAIYEAAFSEDNLTIAKFKNRLAAIFGVSVDSITHTAASSAYGPVVTFTRGTDKLRFIAFGGTGISWETSRLAALAYLKANAAEWEEAP
jgi:hypothetical protein